MKVDSQQQRENPKRNRRLRKKLHVAEFREITLSVQAITHDESLIADDTKYDTLATHLIDTLHKADGYSLSFFSLGAYEHTPKLTALICIFLSGVHCKITVSPEQKAKEVTALLEKTGLFREMMPTRIADGWYDED